MTMGKDTTQKFLLMNQGYGTSRQRKSKLLMLLRTLLTICQTKI